MIEKYIEAENGKRNIPKRQKVNYQIKCAMCGVEFDGMNKLRRYCPECAEIRKRERNREHHEWVKENVVRKTSVIKE